MTTINPPLWVALLVYFLVLKALGSVAPYWGVYRIDRRHRLREVAQLKAWRPALVEVQSDETQLADGGV